MSLSKLLFFILLIGIATQVTGQFTSKFEHLGGKFYAYDGQEGKLHDFAGVFSLNPDTDYLFKKFDKARRGQKTANYTSLALLGAANFGAIAIASGNDEFYTALAVWLIGNMASGITAILGNIISGNNKGKYKREMLDRVNSKALSHTKPKLKLHVGQYGLGMALSF